MAPAALVVRWNGGTARAIGHPQLDGYRIVTHRHRDGRARSVLARVGQRFLDDAVPAHPDAGRDLAQRRGQRHLDLDTCPSRGIDERRQVGQLWLRHEPGRLVLAQHAE